MLFTYLNFSLTVKLFCRKMNKYINGQSTALVFISFVVLLVQSNLLMLY